MSKQYTIRAKTLDLAMRRAKEQFGSDSIVVDTRNVTRKDPDGMGIRSFVELIVEPTGAVPPRSLERAPGNDVAVYEEANPPSARVRSVQREIDRIERLIRSIDKTEAKLQSFNSSYPLGDALMSSGVSSGSLRVLQSEFEERVPASMQAEPDAARMHLLDYLKCARTESFEDISGPHVFMGSAGSGKTSLIIKLTAELVRVGKKTAVVIVAPYHSGEIRRMEEAASALTIDAAVAHNYADLEAALACYEKHDAVLIDTPCVLSRKSPAVTELFDKLKNTNNIFKHYVCSLTNDGDFLFGELELFRSWNCDFLAVSKVDLVKKCGKIVEIVVNGDVFFSFVSYEEADGPGVQIATPGLLLNLISPAADAKTKEYAGEGS